jgi:hypothetical protein
MITEILSRIFSTWATEVETLTWLSLAFIGAIVEVSIPHFGFAFVSAGAIAAAAPYLGLGRRAGRDLRGHHGRPAVGLAPLVGYLGGRAPVTHGSADRPARRRHA